MTQIFPTPHHQHSNSFHASDLRYIQYCFWYFRFSIIKHVLQVPSSALIVRSIHVNCKRDQEEPIMGKVHLLDYVAGNIRSLVNAIEKCGYEVEWIRSPEDVQNAEVCLSLLS